MKLDTTYRASLIPGDPRFPGERTLLQTRAARANPQYRAGPCIIGIIS
jgi:hypothetical protein